MLLIFKKADRVLVWLGKTHSDIQMVFDATPHTLARTLDQSPDALCEEHAARMFCGLQSLFSQPWFRRVWIMQEVWAAREVRVLCGDTDMSWKTLITAAAVVDILWHSSGRRDRSKKPFNNFLAGIGPASPEARAWVEHGEALNHVVKNQHTEYGARDGGAAWKADLVNVLCVSSSKGCTDLRDHVYGVLGMTTAIFGNSIQRNLDDQPLVWEDQPLFLEDDIPFKLHITRPEKQPFLVVDYSRPVCRVFHDVTQYIIRRDRALSILYLRANYGGLLGSQRLASWCPNWSRVFQIDDYRVLKGSQAELNQFAESDCLVDSTMSTLQVTGLHVATIGPKKTLEGHDDGLGAAQIHQVGSSVSMPWALAQGLNPPYQLTPSRLVSLQFTKWAGQLYGPSYPKWAIVGDIEQDDLIIVIESGMHALIVRPFRETSDWEYVGWCRDPSIKRHPLARFHGRQPTGSLFDIDNRTYPSMRKFNII